MAGEYVEFVNNSIPALSGSNLDLMQQRIRKDIDEYFECSSTETQIGYWIDNKPIYRKVILATTDSTENQWKSITSGLNISKIVRYSGNIEADKNKPLPFNSQYQQLWLQINNGNVEVAVAGASFLNKNIQLIIEYTKTTDL